MKRTVIVNCQVYKKDTINKDFPKLETNGKEFRIELDETLLTDEALSKRILSELVKKKENDKYRYDYFNHTVQDYTIEKLSTQKEFINLKNNL